MLKSVKVIGKNASAAQPLTVQLSPYGFTPARFRNRKMHAVLLHVMPPLCRYKMRKRIGMLVQRYLGIRRSARRKIHKHCFVAHRRASVRRSFVNLAECANLAAVIPPTAVKRFYTLLARAVAQARMNAVNRNLNFHAVAFLRGALRLLEHSAEGGTYHGFNLRRVKSVHEILFLKLVGCRYYNCSELMQSRNYNPKLPMPAQHRQHLISLCNTYGLKIIASLRAESHYIAKGENPLLRIRRPNHSSALRLRFSKLVHNVKPEIVCFGCVIFNARKASLAVNSFS